MAKPKTPDQFSQFLVGDFTWRLRELSSLKLAISTSSISDKDAFIRSLVVMCYAHWEGHARYCGEAFVEYLTMRRLRFSEIKPVYYQVRFIKEISASASNSCKGATDLVSRILSSKEDRFSYFPKDLIDTKSNLNSEVLHDLCIVCGLDANLFTDDVDFLDRLLLRRRNEVAHGEAVFIRAVDTDELVDRTTGLMRKFRDELDNIVALGSYRVAA